MKNTRSIRTPSCRAIAIVAVAVAGLVRADGISDATFGSAGVVKVSFGTLTASGGFEASAEIAGELQLAGFESPSTSGTFALQPPPKLFISRISSTGTVSSALVVAQSALQHVSGVAIAPDGSIFGTGSNTDPAGNAHAVVVWFNSAGQTIASYMRAAPDVTHQSQCSSEIIDTRGGIDVACVTGNLSDYGDQPRNVALLRLIPQNNLLAPDPAFGVDGWLAISPPGPDYGAFLHVVEDSRAGFYYFASITSTSASEVTPYLMRFDSTTGKQDLTFGGGGVSIGPADSYLFQMILDSSGKIVIAGNQYTRRVDGCCGEGYFGGQFVARFYADGTPDPSFGASGEVVLPGIDFLTQIVTDANDNLYLLGPQLFRITAGGTRDAMFSASTDAQTINGIGSQWSSMQFSDATKSRLYLVGGSFGTPSTNIGLIEKVVLNAGPTITPTQTTLTALADQTTLTLTVTVTGNNPTGGVLFSDGVGDFATRPLINGTASLSVVDFNPGTFNFVGYYGGDVANAGGNSSAVQLTLAPVSTGVTGTGTTSSGGTGTTSSGTTNTEAVSTSGGGSLTSFELTSLLVLLLGSWFRSRISTCRESKRRIIIGLVSPRMFSN